MKAFLKRRKTFCLRLVKKTKILKKRPIFPKLIRLLNYCVAFFLFISFFITKLPTEKFTLLIILSLSTPLLVAANFILMFYWIFKRKRFFLLSFVFLLIGYFVMPTIYKFGNNYKEVAANDFTIMTFNSRGFNENRIINVNNIDSLIIDFVEQEDPDIICFQEFYYAMKRSNKLGTYTYKFVDFIYGEENNRVIQAIYSKYPILKVEPIEFPKSANSTVYADILIKKDTVRVYNVHLQSFKIVPEVSTIQKEDSQRLLGRLMKAVKLQKEQVQIIKDHHAQNNYKTLIVGDFNNTPFSSTYGELSSDFQDSFLEAGKGFGRTYDLKGLPMRIDYIMADDYFEFIAHQNYDIKLSDHYPVKATLRIKD